jgi:PAS domain S-box-containing protein
MQSGELRGIPAWVAPGVMPFRRAAQSISQILDPRRVWPHRNRVAERGILASVWTERPAWLRYGLAALLVAIAGVCNYLMPPVYGHSHYYFFSAAILGTAIVLGFGPGLFATALSALASAYFFIAPFHSFRIEAPEAAERLALFVVEGAIITGVGQVIRESRTLEVAPAWRQYTLAVLLVAGALALKLLVFPSLERQLPFTFFYSAVVIAAWVGGVAAGLQATVLSAACAYYVFLRPTHEGIPGHPDIWLFCLETTGLCLLTALVRQRMLRSDAYLASVFERSPAGILITDRNARILRANPASERILHTDKMRLEGRAFWEFVHPDSYERARVFLNRLLQQETADMEEIGLVGTTTVRSTNIRASAMREGGDVQTCMLMVEDVTERRKAEETLRQAEIRLERGQRVEAIGMFAGGVAHDFNNLLSVIFGCSDRLLHIEGLPAKGREYAAEILETAQTAADLTRRLLTFARRQPRRDQVTDVNGFVAESVTLLGRLLGSRIEVRTELSPEVGEVYADPSELQQVLLNLAANARDAMPSGGRLTISTSLTDLAASRAAAEEVPAGRYIVLRVADTGQGMDEATQARIFEPFFSTKDLDKGTGLGLATVHSIVKKLGGSVRVESSPGEGACFWVHLPRVDPGAQDAWQSVERCGKTTEH